MISTKQINDLSRPANGWYHIEKSGDHDVDYGEGPAVLRIDEQAIRDMVDDFNARTFDGPGMLIDGDHLSHDLSRDTRALGWLKRLDTYRDPSGTLELYGFIEWTPRGLKMLEDKEYTQSSTEYGEGMTFTDGVYRPSRLTGFALTNRPRIKGKRPLVNRQTSPASDEAGGVSIHALVRVRLLNVYGLIINSATGVLRQPPMGGTKIPGREKEMIVVKIRTPTDYENRRCPGNFL